MFYLWQKRPLEKITMRSFSKSATLFNKMGYCKVQCSGCNVFKAGEQFLFGRRLDAKYGHGTADKLYQKARKTVKLSTIDLEMLINKYQDLTNIKN